MSLGDLVKSAVATAKTLTDDLKCSITLEPFKADDANGNRTYNASVTYTVILENRTRYVTSRDQQAQLSKANIQFLEAVQVKHQDRITLPDGSQPQILGIEGATDDDGNYFAPRVYF